MDDQFELNADIFRTFLAEVVLRKNYGFTVIDNYTDNDDCIICSDTLNDTAVMNLPCSHYFHYECVMEAIVGYKMIS